MLVIYIINYKNKKLQIYLWSGAAIYFHVYEAIR